MIPDAKQFLISGPAGNLELSVTSPVAEKSAAGTAIICHPHPLHGGTMQNKVITTLARAFHDLGLHTVRFNFRGVGKSAGVYDEGRGETDDALRVIEWVREQRPDDVIWVAGFSFGAYVAARVAGKIKIAQLITIAPPVVRFHLNTLPPITCPWLIVQGEKDEVVPPDEVFEWVETLSPKPTLICMPEAGHFFHGQLLELRQRVENALTK